MKSTQPYQPLLLRILHGLTGLFLVAAILTAFWRSSPPNVATSMRLSLVVCAAALVNTALGAVLVNSSDSAAVWRRGLDGILDGFHDQDQTTTHDHAAVTTDVIPASTTSPAGDAALKSLLGISSSPAELTSTKTKNKETSAAATGTSYSVIGSLPPINPPSAAHPNTIPPATPTSSTTPVLPTAAAGYLIRDVKQHPITATSTNAIFYQNSYQKYVVPGEAKGWGMLFTYFFMIYFAILLVHRERRDEEKCRRKYGKDWDRYVELVPWRIIPYVY